MPALAAGHGGGNPAMSQQPPPSQTPVSQGTTAPPPSSYQETPPSQPIESSAGNVCVDIVETPETLVLVAEIPGYEEDDVMLEGLNQQVRITAEREDEYEDDQFHLRERPLRLERIVALPMSVEIDEATATFQNGVCTIEFPKAKQMQSTRIGFE